MSKKQYCIQYLKTHPDALLWSARKLQDVITPYGKACAWTWNQARKEIDPTDRRANKSSKRAYDLNTQHVLVVDYHAQTYTYLDADGEVIRPFSLVRRTPEQIMMIYRDMGYRLLSRTRQQVILVRDVQALRERKIA